MIAYLCAWCGINKVAREGDVCDDCKEDYEEANTVKTLQPRTLEPEVWDDLYDEPK